MFKKQMGRTNNMIKNKQKLSSNTTTKNNIKSSFSSQKQSTQDHNNIPGHKISKSKFSVKSGNQDEDINIQNHPFQKTDSKE